MSCEYCRGKCSLSVLILVLLWNSGTVLAAGPQSYPDGSTDFCEPDHVMITSATYGTDHPDCPAKPCPPTPQCTRQDGRCVKVVDGEGLLGVYENCARAVRRGRQRDELQCGQLGQVHINYECLQGPVHDPCHSPNFSSDVISLRHHWPSTTESPSSSLGTTEACKCTLKSAGKQRFDIKRLYVASGKTDRAVSDILALKENGDLDFKLSFANDKSLPMVKSIEGVQMTLKFQHQGSQSALDFMIIKALNHSVSVVCEGHMTQLTTHSTHYALGDVNDDDENKEDVDSKPVEVEDGEQSHSSHSAVAIHTLHSGLLVLWMVVLPLMMQ